MQAQPLGRKQSMTLDAGKRLSVDVLSDQDHPSNTRQLLSGQRAAQCADGMLVASGYQRPGIEHSLGDDQFVELCDGRRIKNPTANMLIGGFSLGGVDAASVQSSNFTVSCLQRRC
jgi:hypothetical protein